MDTNSVLLSYGLDPSLIKPSQVKLATRQDLSIFSDSKLQSWLKSPDNDLLMVYRIESEFEEAAGFALRNLHSGPRKGHFFLERNSNLKPYFFNLHEALPEIWRTGRVCVVEGSKDALAVRQFGVPVIACLTAAPKLSQLQVLSRYAGYCFWIQDNDAEEARMVRVREQVCRACEQVGLRLHRYRIFAKDPAQQLLEDPKVLQRFAHFFHNSL